MNKFYFVLILFFSVCCTPQQRIKRILKKHPELIHIKDTTIIDTFITRSFYYDTTLKANFFKDTIFVNKNNIQTKVFYNYKTDSIYINNFVPPDTITKTITVSATHIETTKNADGLKYLFIICILILVIFGLIKSRRP